MPSSTHSRQPPRERRLARRAKPLAYAGLVLALFVSTVISLAVKAGTGTAMVVSLFAMAVAVIVCGLCGAALAVRDAMIDLPVEVGTGLEELPD